MKKLYNIVIALFFIPIALNATEIDKFKHEKSKTIKKEFTVNADALMKINNQYGNVDVTSWDGNKIVIDVKITVSGNDEDKVIKRLDMIDVEFESSSSEVSAKTVIQKKSSGWSWNWGKKNDVNYHIDYKIKVPITNNVSLNNDYGNISLNEIKGDATINCDYGKIMIGELHSTNNQINIDYTNNSTIGLMNGGTINADYSEFTLENAGNIKLNADYTTSVFEKINDLSYSCDYGSLTVNNGTSLIGNGDYLTTKLGSISKKVAITQDYGSIRIEELQNGFDSVEIKGEYCGGVKIGTPDAPFKFTINLNYGGFKHDKGKFDLTKQVVKSSSKYYEGYFKSQNSGSTIKIDSDYGSVTFF